MVDDRGWATTRGAEDRIIVRNSIYNYKTYLSPFTPLCSYSAMYIYTTSKQNILFVFFGLEGQDLYDDHNRHKYSVF